MPGCSWGLREIQRQNRSYATSQQRVQGPTATGKDRDDTVVSVHPNAMSGFPQVRLGRVLGYLCERAGIRDTFDNDSGLINGQTISHRCSGEMYLDSCRER